MFTETQEDYIRAIYLFWSRNEGRYPQMKELAEKLGKRRSTVSERLQHLDKLGLVTKEHYRKFKLTKKGFNVAEWLTWKHRVIEIFLYRVLDLGKDKIHEEAHKLEHAFSDESTDRLYNFLRTYLNEDVLTCPHGQPLPKRIDKLDP